MTDPHVVIIVLNVFILFLLLLGFFWRFPR